MKAEKRANIAASHRAKLLALAHARKEDFQFLLRRWAVERFLFRLSHSQYKDKFVLKGAMLFIAWTGKLHRPTKDLDLLGRGAHEVNKVVNAIREICSVEVEDGLKFDLSGIEGWRIAEDAEYEGVRVKVPASLDGARIPMQIDVGFGDTVEPAPKALTFPVLLELDPPIVRAYPPEAVIAEKFHAMVVLGIANSRMKDFFDVWTLASTYSFQMDALSRAVRSTFERRRTEVPRVVPLALTNEFLNDTSKKTQWIAFLRRIGLTGEQPILADIGPLLADSSCRRPAPQRAPLLHTVCGGLRVHGNEVPLDSPPQSCSRSLGRHTVSFGRATRASWQPERPEPSSMAPQSQREQQSRRPRRCDSLFPRPF